MYQANSNKQQKVDLNYYSCNYQTRNEGSSLVKRKLFTRKPANDPSITSEKRKRNVANVVTMNNIVESVVKQKSIIEPLANMVAINRKERHTQNFYKDKDLVKEFAHKLSNEIKGSPQSQKNLMLIGLQFSALSKKKIDSNNFNQEASRKPREVKFQRVSNKTEEREDEDEIAFDKVSIQSFKDSRSNSNVSHSQKSSSYKCIRNADYGYGGGEKRDFDDENIVIECFYCKNNKRIVDILTEKQRKLEEQHKTKNNTIKQLTDKWEQLKTENSSLLRKIQEDLEVSQVKQAYFCKEKQQLMGEIEQLKHDVSMLKERIKYDEIQKSMLLRYRDEFQLLTREFDQVRRDNQQLKRQIASYQSQNRIVFNKSKVSPLIQVKTETQKRYQYYNKKIPLGQKDKYFREDDDISLTLSEQSTDQP